VFTNGAILTLTNSLIIAASGTIPNVHLNLSSNLVAGTYTLATYNTSGSSGAFKPTPVINTGSFAAGTTNYITTADGQVNLVVSGVTLYPPVLSGITMSGGAIILSFSGTNGQTWEILTSTDVAKPLTNWDVVTNGTFSGEPVNYTNSSIAEPQRYYRITSP
jgi:hypothetical protein